MYDNIMKEKKQAQPAACKLLKKRRSEKASNHIAEPYDNRFFCFVKLF